MVLQLGMRLKAREKKTVVRQDKIRDWLARKKASVNPSRYGGDGRQFLETARRIAAILQHGCGLQLPKKRFDDEHGHCRLVANFVVEEAATWGTLKDCCVDPVVLDPM